MQYCGETSKEMTTQFHCSIYFPDCSLIFSTGLLSRLNHRVYFQELFLFTRLKISKKNYMAPKIRCVSQLLDPLRSRAPKGSVPLRGEDSNCTVQGV